MPSGWWNEEVRFLQPKAARKPYSPAICTQLAVGVPVAIGVGLVASRVLHSKQASYIIRSIVRGLIYKQVRAFM